jgi:hypothetical protein
MNEIPFPRDRGRLQESLIITPQSIYEDNHSLTTGAARDQFNGRREQRRLRGVVRCADAREIVPSGGISIGNISGACLPEESIAADKSLESLIAMTHVDGDTIIEGKMPTGCGGLSEKERNETIPPGRKIEGITKYVFEKIKSKDPTIQALLTAESLAYLSDGKPVLAAIQDHLDLTIYPIGFMQMIRGQMHAISSLRIEDIIRYDPANIYKHGLPVIDERDLPEELRQILVDSRREAAEILSRYPNLRELQKVQKPRIVLVTTDIRSARVKMTDTSSIPGGIFKIHTTRRKLSDGLVIPKADFEQSLDQLEFPLGRAVEHFGDSNESFSNTDVLIFDTGSMDTSRKLATQAKEKPYVSQWLQLPDRKIIIMQSNAGVINDIDEFNPLAA